MSAWFRSGWICPGVYLQKKNTDAHEEINNASQEKHPAQSRGVDGHFMKLLRRVMRAVGQDRTYTAPIDMKNVPNESSSAIVKKMRCGVLRISGVMVLVQSIRG